MLYMVLVGGHHARAKIELHDVLFVDAPAPDVSVRDAVSAGVDVDAGLLLQSSYDSLHQQWFGTANSLHIDGWMAVDGVDGYQIRLCDVAPKAGDLRLFFINLGGYQPQVFGEDHRYLLLVAPDLASARTLAKQRRPAGWSSPHTDAVWDIDDCLPIDTVDGRYVQLHAYSHLPLLWQNCYLPIGR